MAPGQPYGNFRRPPSAADGTAQKLHIAFAHPLAAHGFRTYSIAVYAGKCRLKPAAMRMHICLCHHFYLHACCVDGGASHLGPIVAHIG